MSKKTKIFTVLILLIVSSYSLGVDCDFLKEACNNDGLIMARLNELIALLNTWVNRAGVIALILSGFMWFKGRINPVYPISVLLTIIVVNGASDIVAWLAH
jgi:hypothetical protein